MGYAGLVPFVIPAIALSVGDPAQRAFFALALLGYGATIVSFLGAIHWGLVMRDASAQSPVLLAWGVIPSLLAWIALMSSPAVGLFLLCAVLWACFGVDRLVYPRFQVQGWLPMRLTLTVIASASCLTGGYAML
jgi:hypothetical protein